MGSISVRKYIRWPPAPAEEPTSTLVLTSPGRRFVDLRVLLPPQTDRGEGDEVKCLPVSSLDWAIAGTSESWIRKGQDGEDIRHSKWTHWIDSRMSRDSEGSVADEGDMFAQADGTTLELGRMLNPDTGVEADYEELWDDPHPTPGILGEDGQANPAGVARCIVMRLEDQSRRARGNIVLFGQYCQGLVRIGDELAAQRWEWKRGRGWTMTIKIGKLDLPCLQIIRQAKDIEADQELTDGGNVWKVQESVP